MRHLSLCEIHVRKRRRSNGASCWPTAGHVSRTPNHSVQHAYSAPPRARCLRQEHPPLHVSPRTSPGAALSLPLLPPDMHLLNRPSTPLTCHRSTPPLPVSHHRLCPSVPPPPSIIVSINSHRITFIIQADAAPIPHFCIVNTIRASLC